MNVTDLFAFGIGCDLAGAYLVARGLVARPVQIGITSMGGWGYNPHVLLARLEDRASGVVGLVGLVVGFSLQALGYVLGLWLAPSDRHGLLPAVLAASAGLAGVLIILVADRLLRPRLIQRDLPRAVSITNDATPMDHPNEDILLTVAKRRWSPMAKETDKQFLERLFPEMVPPKRISS
jgi:hypothetical protein